MKKKNEKKIKKHRNYFVQKICMKGWFIKGNKYGIIKKYLQPQMLFVYNRAKNLSPLKNHTLYNKYRLLFVTGKLNYFIEYIKY